jgi:hypothetical protein
MTTLENLKERLQHEFPAVVWRCNPGRCSRLVEKTQIPEEIEITAMQNGVPLHGCPWRVSGAMFLRWGVGPTARLVGRELMTAMQKRKPGTDWDKLGE